jgi:hypothetical protein
MPEDVPVAGIPLRLLVALVVVAGLFWAVLAWALTSCGSRAPI